MFAAYVVAGVVLFGREVDDFATFARACVTNFRMAMGDFNWHEMVRVGRLDWAAS